MTSFSHAVLQEGVDVQIIWLPGGHARACVLAYNRIRDPGPQFPNILGTLGYPILYEIRDPSMKSGTPHGISFVFAKFLHHHAMNIVGHFNFSQLACLKSKIQYYESITCPLLSPMCDVLWIDETILFRQSGSSTTSHS